MPSSNWIHDYHPTKIALLNKNEQDIIDIQIDLNDILENRIPYLEEINEQLKKLENFINEEYIENINTTINNINLRKAIITTFDVNGNPEFNSEHYPELIEEGNNNFSDTSICFILNE